jgi:hypothetical protein
MGGKKHAKAKDIPLVSLDDFKRSVKGVFSNTKAESDQQLAAFQASNLRKRETKRRG